MTAAEIVQHMFDNDAFSQWLGIRIDETRLGYCRLSCTIRKEMLNGHAIAHGGISYSIADSSLAFAANTYGSKCVSIETSITHLLPVQEGDLLTAECTEVRRGKSFGTYQVSIENQDKKAVARFRGTVHVSDRNW